MSETVEQLIESWAPEIAAAFLGALRLTLGRVKVSYIVEKLESGDVEGAVSAVGLDPVAFRPFERRIEQAFEAGGDAAVAKIPASRDPVGRRLDVLFDVRNPEAESWLRSHSSTLVREIVDDQRNTIRQALEAGLAKGQNPRTVALDLVGRVDAKTGLRSGGVVGLTSTQEEWARNYAGELERNSSAALTRELRDKRFDPAVKRALKSGEPLSAELRTKMVAAYRNRALRMRGEAIGRTEAATSLHVAQDQGFRQAVQAGQVSHRSVRKVWRSAGDSRVRHTHRGLNGQTVGLDQSFTSSSGARLRFPGDPQAPAAERILCRCTCEYRVDYLANVA